MFFAGDAGHVSREGLGGEGAGGHDDSACLWNSRHFLTPQVDERMFFNATGDQRGKCLAPPGQCAPGWHGGVIGAGQDVRVQPPQFCFQQTRRPILPVGAQGVAAHQLRQVL